jgi:hypothetical protein
MLVLSADCLFVCVCICLCLYLCVYEREREHVSVCGSVVAEGHVAVERRLCVCVCLRETVFVCVIYLHVGSVIAAEGDVEATLMQIPSDSLRQYVTSRRTYVQCVYPQTCVYTQIHNYIPGKPR